MRKAPAFELSNQDGDTVSIADFKGKWIVLYFYPKDNTSGCSNEALDFTELVGEFAELNAVVLGVSPDSSKSHRGFIDKLNLGVTLLSDSDKTVMKAYGAWGMKKNYGREYEGVIRSTFLISPEGDIVESWSPVKVRVKRKSGVIKHADEVLRRLRELKSE